jgi:hypothetical protein
MLKGGERMDKRYAAPRFEISPDQKVQKKSAINLLEMEDILRAALKVRLVVAFPVDIPANGTADSCS